MPSTKKRVNLTIPDAIYEKLQQYKEVNGISGDASACLQLITMQLKAQEDNAKIWELLRRTPEEVAKQIAAEGISALKTVANAQTKD